MTLLLVAMSAICLLAIWVLALCEDESNLDLPRKERVSGWSEAAKHAGIDTFEPTYLPQGAGEPELTVRGIPGDISRPLATEYSGGLILRQAHVDIAPGLVDEPAEVSGSDEAWWGTVQETTSLYVRRGATLIILSGQASDELSRVAGSLRSVDDG